MPREIVYEITSRKLTSFRVMYKANYGTSFKVDGDLIRSLEVNGSVDYVKDWIRERLRKMENGQIKMVEYSSGERDWKQEEKIRKQMWEDVNVNSIPKGHDFDEIICQHEAQTISNVEYKRPPSPTCKIV